MATPQGALAAQDSHAEIERARERADLAEQRFALAQRLLWEMQARIDLAGPNVVSFADAEAEAHARRLLMLLKPMDPIGANLIRVGRPNDGGYVMVNARLQNAIAYSFGIAQDVSWDWILAGAGCPVFQFDHTIPGLPAEHPNFHWSRLGIAPKTGGNMISVGDIMSQHGHHGRRDLVLKMDIEGAEWDVFATLAPGALDCFSQIVVEFHNFWTEDFVHRAKSFQRLEYIMSVLELINATHQVVHIHGNNCGAAAVVGGRLLPDVIEATYVRRADFRFEACVRHFPSAIDQPCRAGFPDFQLGRLGLPMG